MNREQRSKHAHEHYEDIKVRLATETRASIENTKAYGPNLINRETDKEERVDHDVRLVELDSVSCLFDEPHNGKVCILNYASYKHPGGYFLGGSAAQEEALCHESNLYPILLAFDDTYYAWNKERLNKALYLDRALYTPDVVFEHNGQTKRADVLTCAAPNFRTGHSYQNVSVAENDSVFNRRIQFMYQIAEENGVDTLILGAWGCGVFMQNPWTTCKMLTENLIFGKYKIKNVYYAIPNKNSENFKKFEDCLNTWPHTNLYTHNI